MTQSVVNGITRSEKKKKKAARKAMNETLGDRLKEIADRLSSSVTTIEDAEGLQTETREKLLLLANVLTGESSLIDYDIQFAHTR